MRIPDNYSAWDAFDAEQGRQLAELPVCADCEEPIQTETAFYIRGEWLCEN